MVNFTRADIFEFADLHFDYDKLTVTEDGNTYKLSAKFNVNQSGSHYSVLEIECAEFEVEGETISRLESVIVDISQALGEPAKEELALIQEELSDFINTDIASIGVHKIETPLKTMYQFAPAYEPAIEKACNFLLKEVKLPYRIDRYDSSVEVCEDSPDIEFNFRVTDQFFDNNSMTITVVYEDVEMDDGTEAECFVIRRVTFPSGTSVAELGKLTESLGEFFSPNTYTGSISAEIINDGEPYIVLH